MNTRTSHRILSLLALAPLFLLTACTHTIKPPAAPFTGYAPAEKIPLKVALNLTDEVRQSKWQKNVMGDTFVIPIGPSVCTNAETLARHVFTQVSIGASPEQLTQAGAQAVLTPKVAYINRTTGATSFGDSIVAIKVEWSLTEPGGKPIWVDTVSGEGKGSTGWTKPEKIVKLAVEDLCKKSAEAMSSSETIRAFARGSRRTTNDQ